MAMTNAEKQKKYRERKSGKVVQFEHLTPNERVKKWRERNPGRDKEARDKVKLEVLTHYGDGKCACVRCGESRLACLSIDHIDGGGNKERSVDGKQYVASTFYRRLRRKGYPDGYQTLCMNCQWAKRFEKNEHN